MNLILVGLPGSGKGEQTNCLAENLNLACFATGGFFREKAKEDSPTGRFIHQTINVEGKILPDDFTNELVFKTLEGMDWKNGLIFDGYPRTVGQFEALEKYLESKGQKIDKVVCLKISEETAIRRLSSRVICVKCKAIYNLVTNPPQKAEACDSCQGKLIQRPDETPQAIRERLSSYYKQTEPILDLAREKGILEEIDGERPIEVICRDIQNQLKQ